MFVTVKFGADKSKIFNANCKNEILLENMKQQCQRDKAEVVDVSDERGTVKNLRNHPTDYGSEFLKPRETLVLLTVHNGTPASTGDGSPAKPVFTPLLDSLRYDRDFNDKLNQLDKPPDHGVNSPSRRRLQQLSDTDDDVIIKSFKAKVKAINGSGSQSKKSILRRSTKNLFRK